MWQSGVHTLELDDCKRGSRPTVASTPDMKTRVDNAVLKNRNIIVSELWHNSRLSHRTFVKIIHGLGFHNACAHWVAQASCSCSNMPLVVINSSENNILFHHHTLVMKCASMEWEHPGSPWMKKYWVVNSAGKVMGTMFRAHKGVLLGDLM